MEQAKVGCLEAMNDVRKVCLTEGGSTAKTLGRQAVGHLPYPPALTSNSTDQGIICITHFRHITLEAHR